MLMSVLLRMRLMELAHDGMVSVRPVISASGSKSGIVKRLNDCNVSFFERVVK